MLVLAAELHSSQTTAHPFQLLQDLSVSCMSANVLLSFEQLFSYRFVQALWPYKTVMNYFSEKAASYIKTHTHIHTEPFPEVSVYSGLKCYHNLPAALCKRSCDRIISRTT